MPVLIPIFAAIGEAIAAVGTAIDIAVTGAAIALGATGATALAVTSFLTPLIIGIGVTAAVTGIASLFAPTPSFNTSPITFKADTSAGIPLVLGRCAVGGNIVFVDTSNDGNNTWLHYITVLSAGPVTAIDSFTANNVPVTFDPNTYQANHLGYNWRGLYQEGTVYNPGDGVSYDGAIYICEATCENYDPPNPDYWAGAGTYAGPAWLSNMWQVQFLGTQPQAALPLPPNTGDVPEWTSANALSGLACTRWVLKANTQSYPTGTPAPLWVVRGVPAYDPRKDSTFPGGSGSQRANDQTTWGFSENPFLLALLWLLGWNNNGQRTAGVGVPVSRIDLAAYVTGANVADANGWTCNGVAFTTDSKWDVLTAILQAGCGAPMRNGAMISCMVNTPRVSIATLTGADVTAAVTVPGMVARKDRINRVLYTYRGEIQAWQMVQAVPIVVPEYVAADGQQRTKGMAMNYVTDVNQGAQLARYAIEDAREFGPIQLPLKPQWMGLQPGDAITVDEEEFGLNGQQVLILDRKVDPATASPTLTCRSETAAKHAFALGQTGTPPPAPSLTGYDLVSAAPNSPPWLAAGTTVTGGGVSIPAIIVTGTMENPNASNLIVQIRTSAVGSTPAGSWAHYDSPPAPVATRVEITSVAAGVAYDIGLSYLVRGVQGAVLTIGSVTAGDFMGSGAGSSTTPNAVTWSAMNATGAGTQTASAAAQPITGITAPVTLTLTFTGAAAFSYVHNGAPAVPFASGATVSVSNGDTLGFTCSCSVLANNTGTLTVSAGGTTIGAPTYDLDVTSVTTTPSPAIAWPAISASGGSVASGDTGELPFYGINVPIVLTVTFGSTSGTVTYAQNTGAITPIASGSTITVNPGDAVGFAVTQSGAGTASGTITVTNTTAGVLLQTIAFNVACSGSGPSGTSGGGVSESGSGGVGAHYSDD